MNAITRVLQTYKVTLGICTLAILNFALFGEGGLAPSGASVWDNLFTTFLNVFRHGTDRHLFGNLVLIFWAGLVIEPRIGNVRMAWLSLGCIVSATLLQTLLVDGLFIGLSGLAYGVVIFALIHRSSMSVSVLYIVGGLITVGSEIFFMSDTIAVFAHLGGLLFGGGMAMFGKMFGKKQAGAPEAVDPDQPELKPMQEADLPAVIAIINQTDDDDAADAEETLTERGVLGMYTLWHRGQIVGVTGFSHSEAGTDVVWLSWTYLDQRSRKQALGRYMVDELLRILNHQNVRKIFIATSDYKEDGHDVYADARAFYEKLGASLELTVPAFYSADESKLIYGLVNPGKAQEESLDDLGQRGVRFVDVSLDDDSDDIGAVAWEEYEGGVEGIDTILGLANSRQFRQLVVAIPADISDFATAQLETKGFTRIGMLADFYALNLGQVWWTIELN
ncbi:MAG: rhomboid family intramembrane serine protease [Hyphomonadaceae bacterium]